MHKSCICILTFLIILTVNQAFASHSVVVDLSDEDFEEGLLDYENAMVLFYSPSCVHCKDFLPEFNHAADELIRNEPPVHSAKIDCLGTGKHTCKHEDISNLPTIKMYKRATLFDEYDGERSAQELINYMRSLVGITSYELTAAGAVRFANEQKDVSVIAFLKPSGQLRDNYFGLPPQLSKDIRFAHYNIQPEDDGMPNRVQLTHPEYMRNKFEPAEYVYEGDGDDLLEFILRRRHGMVGLRKPKNIDDFGAPLVIAYYPIDIALKPKMFSYWRNRILKVAKNYTNIYLHFAVSPIDDFQSEFTKFGIDVPRSEKPIVFAILEDNTKYLMHDEFSMAAFEGFINSLLDKSAEPHLKSQPIPKPNGEFIVTAVARNFKQVVIESERDVLLEFYAPWCTHCMQLAGTLNELAQIMIDEDVSIVKMDATANEIPADFQVNSFPMVYWLPKGWSLREDSPAMMAYEGGKSLVSFVDFIAAHATHELKNYDRKGHPRTSHQEL